MQFTHAWDDSRLNEEARAFLRTREEDLGNRWAKIVRDAISGNSAELRRVRSRRATDTPVPEGVVVVEADANGVPVRLYVPASPAPPKKIVLYFHGGGWVIGSVQSCSRFCGELARAAGVVVAAVEYRLAPEFPYPAAVEDCRTAFQWMREYAAAYGGDAAQIYAAGDSAGGNLAVALAQEYPLSGLMLFYPVVTLLSENYGASWQEFSRGYALDADLMEAFAEAYVPDAMRGDVRVSPLSCADLSRLPRTLCITAECDILRDQGERFGERLREAGVSVTERCFAGAVHLFVTVAGMDGDFWRGIGECAAFLQQ